MPGRRRGCASRCMDGLPLIPMVAVEAGRTAEGGVRVEVRRAARRAKRRARTLWPASTAAPTGFGVPASRSPRPASRLRPPLARSATRSRWARSAACCSGRWSASTVARLAAALRIGELPRRTAWGDALPVDALASIGCFGSLSGHRSSVFALHSVSAARAWEFVLPNATSRMRIRRTRSDPVWRAGLDHSAPIASSYPRKSENRHLRPLQKRPHVSSGAKRREGSDGSSRGRSVGESVCAYGSIRMRFRRGHRRGGG